jgi:hypothetical protein
MSEPSKIIPQTILFPLGSYPALVALTVAAVMPDFGLTSSVYVASLIIVAP